MNRSGLCGAVWQHCSTEDKLQWLPNPDSCYTACLMQGIITATSRDGNQLSCVLKVSLLLYCLIPGKSNCYLLLLAFFFFFFPKVLVGLWKMSWFLLKVRQPTKHGKSTAQIQSLTTFIALNSLSLLHWPLSSEWISRSIKQQSSTIFTSS